MKAVSVVLVPREVSSVTFGVVSLRSVMSVAPWRSSASPEKAVTAIGTFCRLSSRRRAVTKISVVAVGPGGLVGGGRRLVLGESGRRGGGERGEGGAELQAMVELLGHDVSPHEFVLWVVRAERQPVREILQGGVEIFGLFEVRGVAGALEADGAGLGQGRDEMVGGVGAVERALRAVDDQRRMLDPVEQGANVLADQRIPDRRHGVGVVAGELQARPVGELAHFGRHRLGEDRLAGARARRSRNRRGSRSLRASQASGERPRSHSASFFTRAVMSTTTAPAKRAAAGPASTCHRIVAPSDQPTPIAPSQVERVGELGDVGRHPLDARRRHVLGCATRHGRAGRWR